MDADEWCRRCGELEVQCGVAEAVERSAMEVAACMLDAENWLSRDVLNDLAAAITGHAEARVRWMRHALADPGALEA